MTRLLDPKSLEKKNIRSFLSMILVVYLAHRIVHYNGCTFSFWSAIKSNSLVLGEVYQPLCHQAKNLARKETVMVGAPLLWHVS